MSETINEESVKTGGKNVVEVMLADLTGGRELDLSDAGTSFDADGYIPEGTPIMKDGTDYKPMLAADVGADSGAKDALVIGVLYKEVHKDKPYASICIRGVVNEDKLPFAINDAIKGAVPGISFIKSE